MPFDIIMLTGLNPGVAFKPGDTLDAFVKSINFGWISKKRQLQGARLLSNEAYLRTSKQ